MHKLRKAIFAIFILILGAVIGYSLRDVTGDTIQETRQIEPPKTASTPFSERTFKSPSGKKEIILKGDNQCGTSVILKENGTEQEIGGGLLIDGVSWSPSESKIAYSSGTPSAGYSVRIIDLNTKKDISVFDDQKHFMDEPEYKKYSFGHIYSSDITWLDDNHLIVVVTGRPDNLEKTVPPKYYLIDANAGKVIKEVL